ncbi:MAG TPA: LysR family transcriptional regulator [Candidatus Limiplasma sp.]|nr:LysR family transcriptional regulator [Candidatus Limiplasma sp.]HPS81377.1 LysR family transcriptional regulator [Candidatus Limiplasma sp.]
MAKTPLHCGITLRLYRENKVFGPGVAELLETVRTTHSLRSAAMKMDMAYSKAWKLIQEAEKGLGFGLLDTATGGRQGGGATLTEAAETLLTQYRAFETESKQAVEAAYQKHLMDFLEAATAGKPKG